MNNNKLKQIVVSSLIALAGASCTTAPVETNQQGGVNGVPHSHNGKNHSHPLPSTGLQHTHVAGQTQTRTYDAGTGNFGSNSGSSASSSDSSRDDRNYNDVASSSSSNNDSAGSDSDYYTVKPKDTVFEVMRQTGAYWKDIIRLNDLKAPQYEIQPGQRLKLPVERNS
jgi:LysM repeat protein